MPVATVVVCCCLCSYGVASGATVGGVPDDRIMILSWSTLTDHERELRALEKKATRRSSMEVFKSKSSAVSARASASINMIGGN